MASTNGRSTRDLIDEISTDGHRFRFFQAVRLLALSSGKENGALPVALRFSTPLSLSFPASEIVDIAPRPAAEVEDDRSVDEADRLALQLTVGFMGLTGPSGALPTTYTELLIERRNLYRDTAAHQFFDLFSHRAISLFYEAWRKHRFYLGYEAGDHDNFTRNLLDLVGMGLTPLRSTFQKREEGIPDAFLTHFAGLLARKPVSATSLAALLQGYFKVEAHIEQFVGQWIAVPEAEQTALGMQSCQLGESTFAGERIWDRQTKMRIQLGPLTAVEFGDFLPGAKGAAALMELVQLCVGQSLACDVSLILKREAISAPRLSGNAADGPRLGYNSWLHTRPVPTHRNDACFALLS